MSGRRLQVLVLASPTVEAVSAGLAEAVHEWTGGSTTVETVVASPSQRTFDGVDVVLLGIDVGELDRSAFTSTATQVIDAAQTAGCRVFVVNGSTVVPPGQPTVSLAIAGLNLAAIELSMATGISVVDADRALAELGGDEHVVDPMSYSPVATAAIRRELVRVLEDYGFFDDRALLAQVGQRDGR
jgi:hypothetical protein